MVCNNLHQHWALGIEHAAADKLSRKTHEHSVTCAIRLEGFQTASNTELITHAKDSG